MKSWLKEGKLVPPSSLRAANERMKQLDIEIPRIRLQIDDVKQPWKFETVDLYKAWEKRAKYAERMFKAERLQLEAWILEREHDVEALLADAYALLDTIRKDGCDLSADEEEVIDRVGRRLGDPAVVEKKQAV